MELVYQECLPHFYELRVSAIHFREQTARVVQDFSVAKELLHVAVVELVLGHWGESAVVSFQVKLTFPGH